MRKIIGGKIYDTDRAELIDLWENDCPYGDLNYVREALYRSPGGEFFLVGEGGANTPYSRRAGSTYSAGDAFTVLTLAEALEWMESHGVDVDTITEHFDLPQA